MKTIRSSCQYAPRMRDQIRGFFTSSASGKFRMSMRSWMPSDRCTAVIGVGKTPTVWERRSASSASLAIFARVNAGRRLSCTSYPRPQLRHIAKYFVLLGGRELSHRSHSDGHPPPLTSRGLICSAGKPSGGQKLRVIEAIEGCQLPEHRHLGLSNGVVLDLREMRVPYPRGPLDVPQA